MARTSDLFSLAMRSEHKACCHDAFHDLVTLSEEVLVKAGVAREVSAIAKTELAMAKYVDARWRAAAKAAAQMGQAAIERGKSAKYALKVVDRRMNLFPDSVDRRVRRDVRAVYRYGRRAGWRKATGQITSSLQYRLPESPPVKVKKADFKFSVEPVYELVDAQAIEFLQDDTMFWIANNYQENVRDSIREAALENVREGAGRIAAGKKLRDIVLGGLLGEAVEGLPSSFKTDKYFEGVTANAVTNARVGSQLQSFEAAGVTKYEFVNPMDARTSRECQALNGRVWLVSDAQAIREAVMAAESPEDVKAAHPWLGYKKIEEIIRTKGDAGLVEAGVILPPIHLHCRSTIDVDVNSI